MIRSTPPCIVKTAITRQVSLRTMHHLLLLYYRNCSFRGSSMYAAAVIALALVAVVDQVQGQCGGTYTNRNTDTVYHWSPNYPFNYPNNARCDMIFEHNSTGAYGWEFNTVGFFSIDGPVGNTCYDYVRIVEIVNNRESVLGVFCGANGPRNLRSQTSQVTLQFRSDASGQRQGFNISATPYGLCGGQFNLAASNSMRFVSPNHPQLYPNNALCTYTFTAPANRNISFYADYFNLEQSPSCSFDYLRFNETVRGWPTELGKFCGTNGPYYMKSSTNRVTATFRSDATGQSYGFNVRALSVVGRDNGSLRAKAPKGLESYLPQYTARVQQVPPTYEHVAAKLTN